VLPEGGEEPVVRLHGESASYLACLLPETRAVGKHPALALKLYRFIVKYACKHHCPVEFFKRFIIKSRLKILIHIAFRVKYRKPIHTHIQNFLPRQLNTPGYTFVFNLINLY